MPAPSQIPATDPDARLWCTALGLIGVATLLRLAFLLWVSPYELTADEAQYWDWSRHLELSYHTKGPGVAWTIAASAALFGHSEFAVRAPAVIAWAIMATAVAALARSIGNNERTGGRAALWSVLITLAVPAYHATALLMTIDGPMLACWALSGLAAWKLSQPSSVGGSLRWAFVLGAALGVGLLFKYTILLILPGLAIFFWLTRGGRIKDLSAPLAVSAVLLLAGAAPIVVWNSQRGWPTLSHLLGHVHAAGGDIPVPANAPGYNPLWTLEFIAVQALLIGPIVIAMLLSLRCAGAESAHRSARTLALCAGIPVLVFYLGVSFRTDVEGNWPIAAWALFIPLLAASCVREFDRYSRLVREWLADPNRPRRGIFRRRPETAFQITVHWGIGYGLVGALGMLCLVPLSQLPVVGRFVPIQRLTGARELAAAVVSASAASGPDDVFIVGARYTTTALLAFYLPRQPAVYCAGSRLGDRRSPYDDFPETDLASPSLLGRAAVLVDVTRGSTPERWARAVKFDTVRAVSRTGPYTIYLADRFAGPARNPR